VRELKIKDNNRLEFLTKDIDILNATIEKLENEISNLKVMIGIFAYFRFNAKLFLVQRNLPKNLCRENI
jgi:hypothetical protein